MADVAAATTTVAVGTFFEAIGAGLLPTEEVADAVREAIAGCGSVFAERAGDLLLEVVGRVLASCVLGTGLAGGGVALGLVEATALVDVTVVPGFVTVLAVAVLTAAGLALVLVEAVTLGFAGEETGMGFGFAFATAPGWAIFLGAGIT